MSKVKILSLAEIASQEQKLKAQLAELANAREAQETAAREKIATQVRELPKMLGVGTLADVINLVRQVEKGTLGKLAADASRSYVRLTEAQRAEIVEQLKKGIQASTLVEKYGVSAPTIQSIKKDAGLVKSYNKGEATPAATEAVAATPAS
jgi:hypothetical protein